MPNKDGTGPLGQGTQTGNGLGNCNNNSSENNNKTFFGRFLKWCRGNGNGRGRKRNGNGQGKGFGKGNQQTNNSQ